MTLEEAVARLAIEADFIPAGNSNRPGTPIEPTHVTIHNTDNGDAGADARMHGVYLRSADARTRQVSWHYSVDDHRCVQHLPTSEMGWHAKSGNAVSVGIEVCQNAGIDQNAAIERAALLAAVLMHRLGIANGRLVTHNSWTGKDCPSVILHRFDGGFARFVQMAEEFRAGFSGEAFLAGTVADTEARSVDGAAIFASASARGTGPHNADLDQPKSDRVARLERLLGRREARIDELEEQLRELRSLSLEAP